MEELLGTKKDPLTECFFKETLAPYLVKLGEDYKKDRRPFSILFIDLDRFKPFNDKYGHPQGDEMLKYFSSSLRLSLGNLGIVPFRYGGDEFVIVFPGRNSGEAYLSSLRLKRNMKDRPFILNGRIFKLTFSGGIASYPHDGQTIDDLIEHADKAMYASKRHGHHGKIIQYNEIKQGSRLKTIGMGLLLIIFLSAAALFVSAKYFNRGNDIVNRIKTLIIQKTSGLKEKIEEKIGTGLGIKLKPKQRFNLTTGSATVYLKSGKIFQGIIFREDDREIGIELPVEHKQGYLAIYIKKSDIARIERAEKEAR